MSFRTTLFRTAGPGGWTFARVPAAHAPPVTQGWGMTPVTATVDGVTWNTSVWRDRRHGALLPVPARVRGAKGDGDTVVVTLAPRGDLAVPTAPPRAQARPAAKRPAAPAKRPAAPAKRRAR